MVTTRITMLTVVDRLLPNRRMLVPHRQAPRNLAEWLGLLFAARTMTLKAPSELMTLSRTSAPAALDRPGTATWKRAP